MRDLIRCQNGMARKALGHDVRLIQTQYVKPFLKGHKNDYRDAEAIAEAVQRPTMEFCRSRLRSKVIDFRCIASARASLASAPAACSTSRRSTSSPATGSRSGRRLPAPALPRPGPTIGCASRLRPPNASCSASCRRAGSPNEPKWRPRSLTRLRCLRRPELGYARYRSRFLSRQRAMREGPERARRASASAGHLLVLPADHNPC